MWKLGSQVVGQVGEGRSKVPVAYGVGARAVYIFPVTLSYYYVAPIQ